MSSHSASAKGHGKKKHKQVEPIVEAWNFLAKFLRNIKSQILFIWNNGTSFFNFLTASFRRKTGNEMLGVTKGLIVLILAIVGILVFKVLFVWAFIKSVFSKDQSK